MISHTNGKILKRLFKRGFAVHPDNKEEKSVVKISPLKKQGKSLQNKKTELQINNKCLQ
tara:strand:- start:3174 stop:3350 length:177 start_codon:yes stop_codon:yes gene_type:complete